MSEPSGQQSPMHPLFQAAVATHELFQTYIEAGFTEDQALKLVIGCIQASQAAVPAPPPRFPPKSFPEF